MTEYQNFSSLLAPASSDSRSDRGKGTSVQSVQKSRLYEIPNIHPAGTLCPAFSCLIGFLLINAGMYANWTEAGFFRVEGIQARYFQPLLPLGVIWFICEREALPGMPERTDNTSQNLSAADFAPVIILFCDAIAAVDLCEFFLY